MDKGFIDIITSLEENEIAMIQEVIDSDGDCPRCSCPNCIFGEGNALGNEDSSECALREDWLVQNLDIGDTPDGTCEQDRDICIVIMDIYKDRCDDFIKF